MADRRRSRVLGDATATKATVAAMKATATAKPSGGTAEALELWVVLSRSTASIARHAEADIASRGMTPGEFSVLEVLYHKGPLLLGEVQRKVLVSSGGVTYLVDRLEAEGLVERRACPGDRRARYAALTAAGEARMAAVFPEHAKAIERAVAGLTAAERRTATRLLRKLGLRAAELSVES